MQTKTISLVEALLNTGSGWIISTITWMVIGPLFGYETNIVEAGMFASIFTVVSIVRSYFWRRMFENRLNTWLTRVLHANI